VEESAKIRTIPRTQKDRKPFLFTATLQI